MDNARHESLDRQAQPIANRAYGFHSTAAAPALFRVALGPIQHVLPHERHPGGRPIKSPEYMQGGPAMPPGIRQVQRLDTPLG